MQPAAYTFIYRFMANKSAENPEGVLTKEVLKSFFGFTGSDDDMVHNPGWERIPENWYKRALGDEYTIPFYALDLNAAALQHPQFLDIGGNVSSPSFPFHFLSSQKGQTKKKKTINLPLLSIRPAQPTPSPPSTFKTSPAASTTPKPSSTATTLHASASKPPSSLLPICSRALSRILLAHLAS